MNVQLSLSETPGNIIGVIWIGCTKIYLSILKQYNAINESMSKHAETPFNSTNVITAWTSNYIYVKELDVMLIPCPNLYTVQPPLKLAQGWVNPSHKSMDAITYTCRNIYILIIKEFNDMTYGSHTFGFPLIAEESLEERIIISHCFCYWVVEIHYRGYCCAFYRFLGDSLRTSWYNTKASIVLSNGMWVQ